MPCQYRTLHSALVGRQHHTRSQGGRRRGGRRSGSSSSRLRQSRGIAHHASSFKQTRATSVPDTAQRGQMSIPAIAVGIAMSAPCVRIGGWDSAVSAGHRVESRQSRSRLTTCTL
eukprot:1063699-Rhodomonas_salina.4